MEKIPAQDRFSQNARSVSVSSEILMKAVARHGMEPDCTEVQRLSGGFMNANFRVTSGGRRVVIRVYSTDLTTAKREFDVLRFLESQPVATPRVLDIFEVETQPVVIMEHLAGETLESCLLRETVDPDTYEEIGRQLGAIHNIQLDKSGFIGAEMRVGGEYENFSLFIRQFIEKTLTALGNRPDRLDGATILRFRRLVEDKWDSVLRTESTHQLVHADFNPKNIMVDVNQVPRVTGIIDWEFCLSGNGLIDLGNFFRFLYDYPDGARERFAKGYSAINGPLPENWEDAARLLDLGNMCSFLERQEDYQKSFRTARTVIRATLEHFGY